MDGQNNQPLTFGALVLVGIAPVAARGKVFESKLGCSIAMGWRDNMVDGDSVKTVMFRFEVIPPAP